MPKRSENNQKLVTVWFCENVKKPSLSQFGDTKEGAETAGYEAHEPRFCHNWYDLLDAGRLREAVSMRVPKVVSDRLVGKDRYVLE